MKKKIYEIITNDNYSLIQKIVNIFLLVDDQKDLNVLSEHLNIPIKLLKPANVPEPEHKIASKSEWIREIDTIHKLFFGRFVDWDIAKERGQLNNIIKKIKNIEDLKKLLNLIKYMYEKRKKMNRRLSASTWNFILDNFRPSIIYNNISFLLNELVKSGMKKERVWGWDDKKN